MEWLEKEEEEADKAKEDLKNKQCDFCPTDCIQMKDRDSSPGKRSSSNSSEERPNEKEAKVVDDDNGLFVGKWKRPHRTMYEELRGGSQQANKAGATAQKIVG